MTISSGSIDIGFLYPEEFSYSKIGDVILELVGKLLPTFTPEKFGNYEPLQHKYIPDDGEQLRLAWDRPFLWSAKRGIAHGMVFMNSNYGIHSCLYISGRLRFVDQAMVPVFLQELSIQIPSDLAYIHMFTKQEMADTEYAMYSPYRQGLTTQELRKYLPTLCWGTVWGPPYIELFGRDRLLSTPVYIARELSEQAIYTQLTERLSDLQTQYERVKAVRRGAIEHLGTEAFYQAGLERGHKYQVPQFHISRRE